MRGAFSISIDLPDAAATAALARRIAPVLGPGDTLLLSGPIGTGKTHFARALIRARLAAVGRDEDVPSPTYTLVQAYRDDACEIWHADLYRLAHPDEVVELGLDEAFRTALVLVEWPDRLGPDAPPDALRLDFAPGPEDGRRLTLAATDPRWRDRLASLVQDAADV